MNITENENLKIDLLLLKEKKRIVESDSLELPDKQIILNYINASILKLEELLKN